MIGYLFDYEVKLCTNCIALSSGFCRSLECGVIVYGFSFIQEAEPVIIFETMIVGRMIDYE